MLVRLVLCCILVCSVLAASPWDPISAQIDNQTEIPSLMLVIGNSAGIAYNYSKGNTGWDSPMPVASASKWVSATVFMSLWEKGFLNLTDHPQKYINWWTSDPQDQRSNITFEQLLSFTSGFEGDLYCVGNDSYQFEDCAHLIYNSSFLYTPGTHYNYGGTHFTIAGLMAMKATNKTWPELLDSELFAKLGVTQSRLNHYTPESNPNIAGGFFTTTTVYMKFLQMVYNKTILKPATLQRMQADHTLDAIISQTPVPRYQVGSWHYGYGEWLECYEYPYTDACHAAANYTISSPGAFGYYPWIDFNNSYYGILVTLNPADRGLTSVVLVYPWKPTIISILRANQISTTGTTTSSASSSSTASLSSSTSSASSSSSPTSTSGATSSPSTSSTPSSSSSTSASSTSPSSVSSTTGSPTSNAQILQFSSLSVLFYLVCHVLLL